jgi:hypothetical protein
MSKHAGAIVVAVLGLSFALCLQLPLLGLIAFVVICLGRYYRRD